MTTHTYGDVQEGDVIVLPDGRPAIVTFAFTTDAHGGTFYGGCETSVHYHHDPTAPVVGTTRVSLCETTDTPVTLLAPIAPRARSPAHPTHRPAPGDTVRVVTASSPDLTGRIGSVQQVHPDGTTVLLSLDPAPEDDAEPFAEPGKRGRLCVVYAVEPVA